MRSEVLSATDYSKTTDNALQTLINIAELGPISTADLGRHMNLNRTVVRRLLNTLQGRGFVHRTPNGFVLGSRLLSLADRVVPALRATVGPVMRDLVDELGETVLCHMRQGNESLLVSQVIGHRHLVRIEDQVGSRHPLHHGCSGRAILSQLPEAELETYLTSVGELAGQVRRQVRAAAAAGYAMSHEERQLGAHGLAMAVRSRNAPLCSLSIIVPSTRADTLDDCHDVLARAVHSLAADEFGDD
ncbi:IclR family transcriptional regulator [Amycolatopsis pithecellobii]|uniref:IclR family transcriptional regulator n=1 Tax=Amycolatopsis pithecellobii TaxID=664692 RepID=UPI00140DE8DE|nr:IclR family transcriptional regulator C-terminal domain-containing protein [Amycolatopsis pithecellobii]